MISDYVNACVFCKSCFLQVIKANHVSSFSSDLQGNSQRKSVRSTWSSYQQLEVTSIYTVKLEQVRRLDVYLLWAISYFLTGIRNFYEVI